MNKALRTISCIVLSSITFLCLFGCDNRGLKTENTGSEMTLEEQGASEGQLDNDGRDHTSKFDTDDEEPVTFDVSEVDDLGESILVLDNETLRFVDSEYKYPFDNKPSRSGDRGILVMDENSNVAPILLDRSRDTQLVTTDSSFERFMLQPIESERYYSMDINKTSNWWVAYDEVEGLPCKNDKQADAILKDIGAKSTVVHKSYGDRPYWTTDEPLDLELGGYEGTEWVEGTVSFDTPCVITKKVNPEDYMGNVSKTKEGYFVLDIDDFAPGSYILSVFHPHGVYAGKTNLFDYAYRVTIV